MGGGGNGRIVGLLVLLVLRFEHAFVLLDKVAVAPEVQRIGIASALLAFAEDQGRQAGLAEVRLFTNVAMTESLSYYLHHGYQETHRAVQDGYQRVFSKSISTRSPRGDRSAGLLTAIFRRWPLHR